MTPEEFAQLNQNAQTYWAGQRPTGGTAKKKQNGRGGTLTSLISEGGALGGAAAGAAVGSVVPVVGTAIGGLAGGILGAFGGRLAENKVRDNRYGLADAGKEAALQGVFGGAGKAFKAAKFAATGVPSLENAILQAGSRSTASKFSQNVGGKLTGAADSLATKALKINNSGFATDFANKTGEEIGQFANRFGLVGKDAKQIKATIYDPAQKVYAAAVNQIGDVPKSDVLATIQRELGPKLTSSYPEEQAFAKSVLDQANVVLNKYGKTIPATELNKLKTEAYSKVNNKFVDKSGVDSNNLYDTLSSSFRKAVGEAADKRGIAVDPAVLSQAGLNFKSTKLSDFGNELQSLNEISKKIDQASRVGKGRSIADIGKMLSLTGGGALVGGPVGAAGGLVAASALNNPGLVGKVATGLERAGNKLVGNVLPTLTTAPAFGGAVKSAGKAAAGGSLAEALMNAQSPNTISDPMSNPAMSSTDPMNSNMSQQYQTEGDLSSPQDQNPYPRENLLADIQRDPRNADEYIKLYQQYQDIFAAPAGEDYSQTTKSALASTDNALNTLDQLEGMYRSAGSGSGRIGGKIKGLAASAGFDSNAKVYNDASNASVTQFAKALAGAGSGTVSDMDAKVILSFIPTITDTPAEAKAKFTALRARLDNAKQNAMYYGSSSSSQSQGGALEQALMNAGYQ